jgi:GT2 family glycosyltransferase
MATCKLVTGDGSLDLACRRSFPTLWDGFCRASGLSRLFPGSRLFAKYNLTYLDEDETCEVEAVNGAFMFVRRAALEEVGLLDEDYFMYVEDLDWCYRFRRSGWKIAYHPEARALHLKGRSGNSKSPSMIRRLFESTELFYRKHYFPCLGFFRRMMILLGLRLWKRVTLVRNALRKKKRTRP